MRTQTINFPGQEVPCVFPSESSDLAQAISEFGLADGYPVIVLIGGGIDEQQADATQRAIKAIARIADDFNIVVICGGTDMGVMSEIGQIRWNSSYTFPLIGIAPEELVTWTGGPRSTKFLWWGKKRWQLEPHYSHFILVPGGGFGDESSWIVDAATIISRGHKSVTILINGGEVSRKDIDLSLEMGRPVIALSHTGRLADELSRAPNRNKLITIAPATAEQRIIDVVQKALSLTESSMPIPTLISTTQVVGR